MQHDDVTDAVLSASRALVGVAARSLAEVAEDVTLPQYRAAVVLRARGPLSMSALAEELGCSAPTATRLCDRLVRRGLVARRHGEADRREVEVFISARGTSLVAEVTKRRITEITRILAAVPPAERQAMVRALRAFAAAAGEVPDAAWSTAWSL